MNNKVLLLIVGSYLGSISIQGEPSYVKRFYSSKQQGPTARQLAKWRAEEAKRAAQRARKRDIQAAKEARKLQAAGSGVSKGAPTANWSYASQFKGDSARTRPWNYYSGSRNVYEKIPFGHSTYKILKDKTPWWSLFTNIPGRAGAVIGVASAALSGLVGSLIYSNYTEQARIKAQQELLDKIGYVENVSMDVTGYSPQALLLGATIGEELVILQQKIAELGEEPVMSDISKEIGICISRISAKGIVPYYVARKLQEALVTFVLNEKRLPLLGSVEFKYALAYQVALVLVPFAIARYATSYIGRGAQALYDIGLSARQFVNQKFQEFRGTAAVEQE